jgi:hypothetical protein
LSKSSEVGFSVQSRRRCNRVAEVGKQPVVIFFIEEEIKIGTSAIRRKSESVVIVLICKRMDKKFSKTLSQNNFYACCLCACYKRGGPDAEMRVLQLLQQHSTLALSPARFRLTDKDMLDGRLLDGIIIVM